MSASLRARDAPDDGAGGRSHIKHLNDMVRRVDAATNWLHRDHLSSVRLMTDAAGAQVAENRYRAYGERTDAQLDPATLRESKGWIGERDDPETGLAYLNARYYDPALARFIQPDWWDPTDPKVGTNRYAYGLNNPILMKDPSGHFGLVGGVIGAVVGLAVQAGIDAYSGEFSGFASYGAAAVGGAVTGATAGLGAGAIGITGASIGAGVLGGASAAATEAALNGRVPSAEEVAYGATIGGAAGAFGAVGGKAVASAVNGLSNHAKGKLGEAVTRTVYGLRGYRDLGRYPVGLTRSTPQSRGKAKAIFDHRMQRKLTDEEKIVESKFNGSGLTKNQREAIKSTEVDVSRTTDRDIGGISAGSFGTGLGLGARDRGADDRH